MFERQNMFGAVSSTKIREAFLNNNMDYIVKSCPNAVINRFNKIKSILDEVYNNPKEDYAMK